jgi:L-lactate utilization protein LutB
MAENVAASEVISPFAEPASGERLARVAEALAANGFAARLVDSGDDAKRAVLDLIPPGAEILIGSSVTLETIGLPAEFESGRYDPVRPKLYKLDRRTQMPELRRLVSSPAFMVTSANAVTEGGAIVLASSTGSQIGAVAFGASIVILVIGAQKIVRDLDEAMRRVEEYCLPLEDQRAQRIYGAHSAISKLLVVNKEVSGRTHVVLVKEPLGY